MRKGMTVDYTFHGLTDADVTEFTIAYKDRPFTSFQEGVTP